MAHLDEAAKHLGEAEEKLAEVAPQLAADLTGDRSQKEQVIQAYQKHIDEANVQIAQHKEMLTDLTERGQTFRSQLTALNEEKIALEKDRTE